MTLNIANVAVPRPIDRTFDYIIPRPFGELPVGVRVEVRFGRDTVMGYVVGLKNASEFEGNLQPILRVLDEHPILDKSTLALANWMREHYLCPLGLVLQAVLPKRLGPAKPSQRKLVELNLTLPQTLHLIENLGQQAPQQVRLLRALLNTPTPPMSELLKQTQISPGPLRALAERKAVKLLPMPIAAFETQFDEEDKAITLSQHQEKALSQIDSALQAGAGGQFLLQGVNGSGKTEVYLQASRKALSLGKAALILTPEISLTPQLINRFKHRLGDQLAVLHSGLTQAQQAREWTRLREGKAKAVLGVRSASLLPIEDLGLVIVDEEHEPTYQQDSPEPRYHARDVLMHRCQSEDVVLLLGSATPSLMSHHAVEQKALTHLVLPERIVSSPKPKIEIVDISEQRGWMSPLLKERLTETLEKGQQAMLMLNRKGFGVAFCKQCKNTKRCPNCDICLVYQVKSSQLLCHYCDYSQLQATCADCGRELAMVGTGTQRVEVSLKKHFPTARVARMDSDSVKRGQHDQYLEGFRRGDIDILLGTQMIAMGHDFPNVQLMGIVDADTMLHLPDYRASERTFQLISQAMGRAGRGNEKANVVVQTRHRDHYALAYAVRGDYDGFAAEELSLRQELGYPPFKHIITVQSSHKDEDKSKHIVEDLLTKLHSWPEIELLGPSKGLPYQWRSQYRWKFIIKTDRNSEAKQKLWALLKEKGLDHQLRVDVEG